MGSFVVKVDEEGVELLRNMADGIEDRRDEIMSVTVNFLDEIEQYSDLGPHRASLIEIVTDIQEQVKGATSPVAIIADKFRKKADEYQEIIDDDVFSGLGN